MAHVEGPLHDAKESLAEYWEWETDVAPDASPRERKLAEGNQQWLLERAKVSALVSIAESLNTIATATRQVP